MRPPARDAQKQQQPQLAAHHRPPVPRHGPSGRRATAGQATAWCASFTRCRNGAARRRMTAEAAQLKGLDQGDSRRRGAGGLGRRAAAQLPERCEVGLARYRARAALSAVAYRMAVQRSVSCFRSLMWPGLMRIGRRWRRSKTTNGLLSPAVNPYGWHDGNKYTAGSPEGQAVAVLLVYGVQGLRQRWSLSSLKSV